MTKQVTHAAEIEIEKVIDQFLTLLAEEKKRSGLNPWLNTDGYKAQFRTQVNSEITSCLEEFQRRLGQGLSAIWDWLDKTDKKYADKALFEVQETLNSLKLKLGITDLADERIKTSDSFKKFIGFSEETMGKFYHAAYALYEAKHLEQAADSFYFLCAIDPLSYQFWLGYGYSEHLLHRFDSALHAYAMASLTNINDPAPYYLSAQCYEKIGNIPEAINSLNLTINHSTLEDHKQIKNASFEMKNRLSMT